MSQRDHFTGVVFLCLLLGAAAAAFLAWMSPERAAAVLAVVFLPMFVVSHWAAELLGAAWDRWSEADSGGSRDEGSERPGR